MKTLLIIFALIPVLMGLAFLFLGWQSKTGQPSGLVNQKLTDCGSKPNCVISETNQNQQHRVEAIAYSQSETETTARLKNIVIKMGGKINIDTNTYIASTFTSSLFGFVDDLELRLDPHEHLIHIRSASRVGYSDRGVNRKRIETLRKLFTRQAT